MDWKQGLTAAVVVGLGYLGFQNVTKGAESRCHTEGRLARMPYGMDEVSKGKFNEGNILYL